MWSDWTILTFIFWERVAQNWARFGHFLKWHLLCHYDVDMGYFSPILPGHQCDQIWRNFVTLCKMSKSLEFFLRVYLIFGIVMILLWLHFYDNKLILFAENGQTFETIKPFGHTPLLSNVYQIGTLTSKSFIDSLLKLIVVSNSWNLSSMEAVWPDWAIYWTLGNF